MNLSRREALFAMGGTFAGLAVGSGGCSATTAGSKKEDGGKIPDFWTTHKLDPNETAQRAYDGFYLHGRGCCYGVFSSVIGQMGEKYGAPYDTFPLFMMKFGYSGVSNWGTLCGALMGAAAMYALFYYRTDRDPMIDELFSRSWPLHVSKQRPTPYCATTQSASGLMPAAMRCTPSNAASAAPG